MRDYLFAALLGYLLGTPNPAVLLAKLRGVDVAENGTGNPGASNTALLLGLPMGLLVCFFDIGKAFLAVRLCRQLFPAAEYAAVVGGASCVLGHMFPFHLRFHGGKGFASYIGLILALDRRFILYFLIPIVLTIFLSDYLVFGNLVTIALFPIYCAVCLGAVTASLVGAVSAVALYRHRGNLAGVRNGTEMRIRHRERNPFRLKK